MSNIALRVEGLGKKYRIGERREAYKTFRDGVATAAQGSLRKLGHLFGRNGSVTPSAPTDYWALRDVSFEVKHGDVVGIIGKNGAGKSTLLKILSRITEPTEGRARVFGRVGSLLEVGTGFHPELTGRENIYMNGAILGMSKADIDRKFDEIVAFAEVDTYLDTPVKRYSSGMQLRLGFAVAAHMEPEILIVDEVLAVGDAAFQKKCMGKMGDVARGGRTVLFVSHNMVAVQILCERALILEKGKLAGDTKDVGQAVRHYGGYGTGSSKWVRGSNEFALDQKMSFTSIECQILSDQSRHTITLKVELKSLKPHSPAFIAFDITDASMTPIMQALPNSKGFLHYSAAHQLLVEIDIPPLIPGTYRISSWVGPHYNLTYDLVGPVLEFAVVASPNSDRSFPYSQDHGHLVPPSRVANLIANIDDYVVQG
jgi:lipopolysaccharide transport system ATP-binding protein